MRQCFWSLSRSQQKPPGRETQRPECLCSKDNTVNNTPNLLPADKPRAIRPSVSCCSDDRLPVLLTGDFFLSDTDCKSKPKYQTLPLKLVRVFALGMLKINPSWEGP